MLDQFLLWVACQIKHDWKITRSRRYRVCLRCEHAQKWNTQTLEWENFKK